MSTKTTPISRKKSQARASAPDAEIRHDAEAAAASFPALMIEAERIAHTVAAGLHGRRRAGPGETFWQHRAYGFGDAVSMIDWRQSARAADRLYVRQNEWEAAASVWIWRDPSHSLGYASSPSTPTKRRRADVMATALAILLSQAGERVGLSGAQTARGGRLYHGRNAPSRILEALLLTDFQNQPPVPPLEQIGAQSRMVLLSDFYAEPDDIKHAVNHYAALGVKGVLLQVVDPAEETFPFSGRTEFTETIGSGKILLGQAASVKSDYQQHYHAHRDELRMLCARLGWQFLVHRTDNPPQHALLAMFQTLADQRASS